MTDLPERGFTPALPARGGLATRLWMNPRVQSLLARMPVTGRIARAEGAAMFGLVGGFVKSQILLALVELRVLEALVAGAACRSAHSPGRSGLPRIAWRSCFRVVRRWV